MHNILGVSCTTFIYYCMNVLLLDHAQIISNALEFWNRIPAVQKMYVFILVFRFCCSYNNFEEKVKLASWDEEAAALMLYTNIG